jgi:hypothetical protein
MSSLTFDISDFGLFKAMFGSTGSETSGTSPLFEHSTTVFAMFFFQLKIHD